MNIDKRYLKGVLNADGSPFAILPDEHINGLNMRIGLPSSATSSEDEWEAVGSTIYIPNNLPAGTNIGLGGCWDEQLNRIIWANWNSLGSHGVYVYDIDANIVYTALLSTNVTGGLNFNKYSCIHSCFAVNHNFYWVDSTINEPRRFNVDAGIKLYQGGYVTTFAPYQNPIAQSVISWIRRPPGLPPIQVKSVDSGFANNFTQYEAFEFMYRYQYRDYEYSTLGPYSTLAPYNDNLDTTTNRIDVTIPFGEHIEQDVLQVDLVVRFLNTNKYDIIKSWNRNVAAEAAQIAAHNAGTTALTYVFYNNFKGITLDDAYGAKPFDSVPIKAETCAEARDRSFLANYTIGYNTPAAGTSLAATPVVTGGSATGGIDTAALAATITGVTIGGTPVSYVTGTPLPVGPFQLGTYITTQVGLSKIVVISVTGSCTTVRVRYGTDGITFTNVDQPFTGAGDYTFSGIPINSNNGTIVTWICVAID
jgi:hypothetical protein